MAYAQHTDVAAQWRALSSEETTRATALLEMAAILIDFHVDLTGLPDSHPKIRVAKQVSIDMVIEALESAGHRGGVASYSVQLDNAIDSRTYREGDYSTSVVFTGAQRALFGLSSTEQSPVGFFGDHP
ncbi:hypothetical protein [Gordonia sp. SCSIO 19800]|uniref:hypothetical protein n=1 Tax=Gordonia sp. SCSIO 19800 TaxID=2826926 RepID=UPI001B8400E9|nr:hypothetical protein [Gordonia sp. SCSIO 19800]MBR7191721.1 hypothetical protein [Gordonia sp. SCSIO 19800]